MYNYLELNVLVTKFCNFCYENWLYKKSVKFIDSICTLLLFYYSKPKVIWNRTVDVNKNQREKVGPFRYTKKGLQDFGQNLILVKVEFLWMKYFEGFFYKFFNLVYVCEIRTDFYNWLKNHNYPRFFERKTSKDSQIFYFHYISKLVQMSYSECLNFLNLIKFQMEHCSLI